MPLPLEVRVDYGLGAAGGLEVLEGLVKAGHGPTLTRLTRLQRLHVRFCTTEVSVSAIFVPTIQFVLKLNGFP